MNTLILKPAKINTVSSILSLFVIAYFVYLGISTKAWIILGFVILSVTTSYKFYLNMFTKKVLILNRGEIKEQVGSTVNSEKFVDIKSFSTKSNPGKGGTYLVYNFDLIDENGNEKNLVVNNIYSSKEIREWVNANYPSSGQNTNV